MRFGCECSPFGCVCSGVPAIEHYSHALELLMYENHVATMYIDLYDNISGDSLSFGGSCALGVHGEADNSTQSRNLRIIHT